MKKNKRKPIPESFESAEKAGEFWETHDLTDYWDQTRDTDLKFNLKRRHFFIGLEPGIAQELQRISEREGISTETMANLWLKEKILEKTNKDLGSNRQS
jgi:hypothetical protein